MTSTVANISRFTANIEQGCTGCGGRVAVGTRGGYAPGAKVLCQDCCGGDDGHGPVEPITTPNPASVAAAEAVTVQRAQEELADLPEAWVAELSVSPAIIIAAGVDPVLCGCVNRKDGFTRNPDTRDWVHAGCGLPAVLTGAEAAHAENEAWVSGETSVLDRPDESLIKKETCDGPEPTAAEPAGAPEPAPAAEPAKPKRKRRTRRQPDAGEQAGPTDSGVRADQAAGGRESGAAEGDHRRDQGGAGQAAAARGDVDSADQPAPDHAAEVRGGGELPAGREGDQGGGAGTGVAAVVEDVHVVAPGSGQVLTPMSGIMGAFYAQAAPVSAAVQRVNGNTPFAEQYARELRNIVEHYAGGSARNLQRSLGPSEIGHSCHRQVAGKLAQLPAINHTGDPWPSIMGTAGHAWMEGCLQSVNDAAAGQIRFLTEHRVTPTGFEAHPGTGDGYDALYRAVIDHKFLGDTSMGKLRQHGAPRHYYVQTLLYALGFMALGLPVERVMLLAWPRTRSSLDAMYVWEHVITAEDHEFLGGVIAPELAYRKQWAAAIVAGTAQLMDVPADTEDECQWCLAGETGIVTREGIRPIRELAGGEHELLVPMIRTPTRGTFQRVPVRSFGEQRLYAVKLRRYKATKTVYATAEHRWVTAAGERLTTMDLRTGTQLCSLKARGVYDSKRIPMAVAQGFTYGDGTRPQVNRPASLAIYGRSTGDEHMLPFFGPVETTITTSADDDKVTTIYGLPRFWKDLPPLEESRSFLLSWLAGYFAADGNVSDKGQAVISSANRASLEFVRDIAAVCGVGHGVIGSHERLGRGQTPTALYSLSLSARDLPDWFWVLPHQAVTIAERVAKAPRMTNWSVVGVEPTDRVEEVFCATVPKVEAFALADGLTTGNCPFYRPASSRDGLPGCPGHTAGN